MSDLETGRRFANRDFSFLPDAPTIMTVRGFNAPSPYHERAILLEERFRTLAQIANSAIAFAAEYSETAPEKLDFSLGSLAVVDQIIDRFQFTNKRDLEMFVAMAGSYVGKVMELAFLGRIQWDASRPKDFHFSALRMTGVLQDGEGNKAIRVIETSPFAQVVKKVLESMGGESKGDSPTMVQYVQYFLDRLR